MSFRFARFAIVAAYLLALNADSSSPLPQGWTVHSSEGVAYYYNQNTGVTQWEKPTIPNQGYSSYQLTGSQRGFNQGATGGTTASNSYQNQGGYTLHNPINHPQSRYHQQVKSASLKTDYDPRASTETSNPNIAFIQSQHHTSQTLQKDKKIPLESNNDNTILQNYLAGEENQDMKVEASNYDNISSNHNVTVNENEIIDEHFDDNIILSYASTGDISPQYQTAVNIISKNAFNSEAHIFITKLKDADKKIDELNNIIDVLEDEKMKLLNLIKSSDEVNNNITLVSISAVTNATDVRTAAQLNLTNQIDTMEQELEIYLNQSEEFKGAKKRLETDLIVEKEKSENSKVTLIELKSNYTINNDELNRNEEKLKDQEKELFNVYKLLGQLEEDLKNIAEPSLRRLRKQSIFKRILIKAFPVWIGSKSNGKNVRRATGRNVAKLASDEMTVSMNNTIEDLRLNLKKMSNLFNEKEIIIGEISERLAEHIDEDEKRCSAHAALKEGVNNLNEENEKLLEALELRDEEISEISLAMKENLIDAETIRQDLSDSEKDIKTQIEKGLLDDNSHKIAIQELQKDIKRVLTYCDEKEVIIDSLSTSIKKAEIVENDIKIEINNVTENLNNFLRRQQAEAKRIVEESLLETKNKPWFLCLWPF